MLWEGAVFCCRPTAGLMPAEPGQSGQGMREGDDDRCGVPRPLYPWGSVPEAAQPFQIQHVDAAVLAAHQSGIFQYFQRLIGALS